MTVHDTSRVTTADGDDATPQRPPTRKGYSIKAAMIVPGIGAGIIVVFIALGVVTSNPVQPAKISSRPFSVPGTSVRARPAVKDLKVITKSGQPPGNIVNAVSVPANAKLVSHQNNSASEQGSYDAQITLTADDSQAAVENFYSKVLKKQGWQIISTGPADHQPGALEVLGKKAGSDGFYWEVGAVVSATTFGANAPAAGSTSFSLELYQQPDPD